MATNKTPVKKAARKTTAVTRARPVIRKRADDRPNPFMAFESTEERLKYLYGSMTPEESLEILYEAGILTPSGRLSPEYK